MRHMSGTEAAVMCGGDGGQQALAGGGVEGHLVHRQKPFAHDDVVNLLRYERNHDGRGFTGEAAYNRFVYHVPSPTIPGTRQSVKQKRLKLLARHARTLVAIFLFYGRL